MLVAQTLTFFLLSCASGIGLRSSSQDINPGATHSFVSTAHGTSTSGVVASDDKVTHLSNASVAHNSSISDVVASNRKIKHIVNTSTNARTTFNATTNATTSMNATANGTANTTRVFEPSCAKACDVCFAEHLMQCTATCYKGLQAYCTTQCTTSCTPMWSASPGTSTANGLDKKYCDGTVDADGCPFQNYDR